MERVSVLCLLLLFCSLLGAEHQDNEIIEQREASPESGNVLEEPHPCLSDVHAALRDMSAKLAENRLLIQQLQTLNQEQAAKLAEVDTLKQQQQEQGVKLKELEKQTNNVENQQQDQAAALYSLMTRTNVTENHVDFLRREREVGQVAFSASLKRSGYIGPFDFTVTLSFDDVISNIGNAYDPRSGEFSPPVRGVYHFQLYISGLPDHHGMAGAYIMRNTGLVVSALGLQAAGSVSPSNGATLLLEPGDGVFVRLLASSRIEGGRRTTFSGHLLFPL